MIYTRRVDISCFLAAVSNTLKIRLWAGELLELLLRDNSQSNSGEKSVSFSKKRCMKLRRFKRNSVQQPSRKFASKRQFRLRLLVTAIFIFSGTHTLQKLKKCNLQLYHLVWFAHNTCSLYFAKTWSELLHRVAVTVTFILFNKVVVLYSGSNYLCHFSSKFHTFDRIVPKAFYYHGVVPDDSN